MTEQLITRNPAIAAGKPILRGTRVSVEFVIGLMADGWTTADILEGYPRLSKEQIEACLRYALDLLESEKISPAA